MSKLLDELNQLRKVGGTVGSSRSWVTLSLCGQTGTNVGSTFAQYVCVVRTPSLPLTRALEQSLEVQLSLQ